MMEFGETHVYTCRKMRRILTLVVVLFSIVPVVFMYFMGVPRLAFILSTIFLLLGVVLQVILMLKTQNDYVQLDSRGMTGIARELFRGTEINFRWSEYEKIEVSSVRDSQPNKVKYQLGGNDQVKLEMTRPNGDVDKISLTSLPIKRDELIEAINYYSGRILATRKPKKPVSRVGIIIMVILNIIMLIALILKMAKIFG